jgi:hypothetical protein
LLKGVCTWQEQQELVLSAAEFLGNGILKLSHNFRMREKRNWSRWQTLKKMLETKLQKNMV